ncbi:carboxylate-amine ligase, YbdK family [Hoeflea sp. IMCC20628]|uniref:carboxylate-amine ligase n=1 Tax=Hoeflea sp. IMCC20628 TaxID=1620421 RepID=UPI00063ABBF9|nr:carboxylate-amine ligase [Hoeflea sp. IMCC20628]AKH98989.1 carboxylate-amine ligase, YbdK family [Hoeflea sp. IMCC20628]
MSYRVPSFTLGVEEEYLLVDCESLDLAAASDALMTECAAELGDQVSPEFLQCQIEVGTGVCRTVSEAGADLARLRSVIASVAGKHCLAPLAVSCHPFADWHKQHFTDKPRYRELERDLGGVARRMLICGMHVHVGIDDDETRIDLMAQFPYFLPHLLALSTSSPYWKGDDTGLNAYRLTVFDNMPRTGLPPRFSSWSEYERSVQIIIDSGLIEDSTKIWWDLRPSGRFPTLESRICDVSPRLDDALAIVALTQSIMHMLWRLRTSNQRWRIYDRFLVGENRWRAQRYGVKNGMIDFARGEVVAFTELLEEIIDMVREDAEALGCWSEVQSTRSIIDRGTSADRQRSVHATAIAGGASTKEAQKEVVRSLIGEFTEGLEKHRNSGAVIGQPA